MEFYYLDEFKYVENLDVHNRKMDDYSPKQGYKIIIKKCPHQFSSSNTNAIQIPESTSSNIQPSQIYPRKIQNIIGTSYAEITTINSIEFTFLKKNKRCMLKLIFNPEIGNMLIQYYKWNQRKKVYEAKHNDIHNDQFVDYLLSCIQIETINKNHGYFLMPLYKKNNQ